MPLWWLLLPWEIQFIIFMFLCIHVQFCIDCHPCGLLLILLLLTTTGPFVWRASAGCGGCCWIHAMYFYCTMNWHALQQQQKQANRSQSNRANEEDQILIKKKKMTWHIWGLFHIWWMKSSHVLKKALLKIKIKIIHVEALNSLQITRSGFGLHEKQLKV